MKSSTLPDGMPVLSRGRHRTPRRGACFMEFASLLAGERWSDHPSCTHPLLGAAGPPGQRQHQRHRSAGAGSADPVGRRPARRRHDLAQGLGRGRCTSRSSTYPRPRSACSPAACSAPSSCAPTRCGARRRPDARHDSRWTLFPTRPPGSSGSSLRDRISMKTYATRCAPMMIHCAVEGIVGTACPDHDRRLRDLLEVGIAACPWPPVGVPTSPTVGATADGYARRIFSIGLPFASSSTSLSK